MLAICNKVGNWKVYAPYLGLSGADIDVLESNYRRAETQCFRAFKKWKERAAFKATYLYLVDNVFLKYGNAELATYVGSLLK